MEDTSQDVKQKTYRRDTLLEIQSSRQSEWQNLNIFQSNAPPPPPTSIPNQDKFFGNFPFPYMNGLLHLGHAFSISKLEFKCAYERLQGKNVLFPQGFHCTGMPIKVIFIFNLKSILHLI